MNRNIENFLGDLVVLVIGFILGWVVTYNFSFEKNIKGYILVDKEVIACKDTKYFKQDKESIRCESTSGEKHLITGKFEFLKGVKE